MADERLGGRLPLLPTADLDPAARGLYDRILAARGGGVAPFRVIADEGELIGPFNACLHAPEIGAGFLEMHQAEAKASPLSPRVREVVILSVGAVWRSAYELYAHRAVAATRGLSATAVERLADGEASDELTGDETAAQRLTLELTRDRHVTDETYAACERELGRDQTVAIIFLAAAYMGTCTVLNAFDVPAPADGSS